jgi:hypothetical protein
MPLPVIVSVQFLTSTLGITFKVEVIEPFGAGVTELGLRVGVASPLHPAPAVTARLTLLLKPPIDVIWIVDVTAVEP